MRYFFIKWGMNSIALFAVVHLVAGVSVTRWESVLVGALVIGLLNAFLRPILILFTLPVNVLTLGLFTFILNGIIFYLAASLVKGFYVSGFWNAVVAAFVFSIISFFLSLLVNPG